MYWTRNSDLLFKIGITQGFSAYLEHKHATYYREYVSVMIKCSSIVDKNGFSFYDHEQNSLFDFPLSIRRIYNMYIPNPNPNPNPN